MGYIFLYRLKNSDDRDCCAYLETTVPRWECDHYFGTPDIHGSCYGGGNFAPYDEIDTVLTEEEYQQLLDYRDNIKELGYGIKKGDVRYTAGMMYGHDIRPVYAKLMGPEGQAFFEEIKRDEDEWLMNQYDLDEEDIKDIFYWYGLDYHDRSVVCTVFRDAYDCGYEEAWNLGYVDSKDTIMNQYFNFEQFGQDLANEDELYVELRDGRIVRLSS